MTSPASPGGPPDAGATAAADRFGRRSVLAGLGGLAALAGIAGCAPGGSASAPAASAGATPAAAAPPSAAKLELILLGTQAGPPVQADRAGIASALVVDGHTYVIDCGRSAVTQYARAGLALRSLTAIFLTHLHADHLADYYNFFMLGGHIPNVQKDNLAGPVPVYGPGSAGGLPGAFGGGQAPTVYPPDPAPGTAELTEKAHQAYAYSTNIFMRDMSIRDIRTLPQVHEIALPDVGASFTNTAPAMRPFPVMRDDRVQVSATLVPHGPVFPAFAFRFDTRHGSVTFSGDTAKTENLITLADGTDILVHEAISMDGANPNPAVRDHMLQSHVLVQELGPIAKQARAKHLVLSHIGDLVHDPLDADQWTHWAARGYDGPVTVGQDLQRFVIA